MAFTLGSRGLPTPQLQGADYRIKGVGIHKRAYAKIQRVGGGVVGCAGSITSIESDVKKKHSELMSSEGGRLTPKPILESISISNDGGQDISDAMLFEADVKVKVYNKSDFDQIDQTFMTPRQRVNLIIGWVGSSSVTVKGEITGFNFTINQDLSYDVSLKVAGAADGVVDVDYMTLKDVGAQMVKDEESGKEVPSKDLITNLVGIASKISGQPSGGKAKKYNRSGVKLGLVNHQMQTTGFFSFFDSNKDNVLPYVSLGSFLNYINKNAASIQGLSAKKFDYSKFTLNKANDSNIKSANPLEVIFGWSCNYGSNANYSDLKDGADTIDNIYISIPLLQKMMSDLQNPPGKEESPKRISTPMFLKKVFNKIKELSGGYLTMFLYNDPDIVDGDKGKFLILNKGTAAKSTAMTTINLANGFNNGIRDCSLTSNLDSELISMATAAAMDGEGAPQLNKVFGGCYPEGKEPENTTTADLKKALENLGDNISDDDITGAQQALKAYVKSQNKQYNPNISYGLECELTCDGYSGPKYGDAFTVDRLPKRLKDNAYFIVTKLGQDFSAGDWTTKISGLMMIDA